jgi:hypothetical protein
MSAGELYVALEEFDIDAVDTSGADTFDSYYRDGGSSWTKVSGVSAWNNTQYDDNSGVLADLSTAAKYAVNWFYLETDGAVVHVYGQGEYSTLTLALSETPPTTLPGRLELHGVLLGAVVFQKNDTTAKDVKTAFTETFGSASVTAHNTLSGLSSDDHTQYALLAGRSTASDGQTLYGSDQASENLYLQGTSHATDGSVIIYADDSGNNEFYVGPSATTVGGFTKVSGDNFVYVATDATSAAGVYFYNVSGGWYINSTADGYLNFYDVINSKLPFNIEKGCDDYLLYLKAGEGTASTVGIGTNDPTYLLHVYKTSSNEMMLECPTANSTAGYSIKNDAVNWRMEVAGSGGTAADEFRIVDITNSKGPLAIAPSAPSNSIYIDANGRVGIGTNTMGTQMVVKSTASNDSIINVDSALKTNGASAIDLTNDAQNWRLICTGGSSDEFQLVDTTNTKTPFVVGVSPTNHQLYLEAGGKVGLAYDSGNTSLDEPLHIQTASGTNCGIQIECEGSNEARIHFKNAVPQEWEIKNNSSGVWVLRDLTNSKSPHLVYPTTNSDQFTWNVTSSRALACSSTTRAMVLPRMTTAQMNAIAAPINGMILYNTSVGATYAYEGGAWVNL